MNINDLMKPRFELIADYPGNSQPVGNITIEDATASYFRKFTSNFRELVWYENRKEVDMPMYLKFVWEGELQEVVKVDKWLYQKEWDNKSPITGFTHCSDFGTTIFPRVSLNGWTPATEAEYLSHRQKLETAKGSC